MGLPKWLQLNARQVLSLMVFWGQIQNYMMRSNLSILIVAMVKDPIPQGTNLTSVLSDAERDTCLFNTSSSSQDEALNNHTSATRDDRPDEVLFEWDAFTRGLILSSFSYGYITTQIIGGRLTEIFGVKKVYGLCLLATAVLTLLSPIAAKLHVAAFMTLRGFQGVFEGVTFPALQAMTARWIPLEERTSFIARSFFGTTFGLLFTFPLCGSLAASYGWESAFYVIGCITFVWFGFWWYFVYDGPDFHPRISQSEKDFIVNSLAGNINSKKTYPVPWKKIFTSIPFFGLVVADTTNSWGIISLGSNGPTYLKYMLGVDIKTNGILSGLPMMCRYIGGIVNSALADWLQRRNLIKVIWTRRIFNSVAHFGPAIAMLMLAFPPLAIRCHVSYAMVLLCIGMFLNGALSSGHFSSFVDLSPNFAGTLMGISNTGSSIFGFVVPILIGFLTTNMTFSSWEWVFGIAATVYTVGNLIYVFTIEGEPQEWNNPTNEIVDETNEEKQVLADKSRHYHEETL